MQTFAIYSLGCKVNLYESQAICNELTSHGLIEVDFKSLADIYIINTCSVTNTADLKSRNIINRARKLSSQAIIIVAGCYSQIASQKIAQDLNVQIVIGNKYKNQVYQLLQEYLNKHQQIVKIENLLQPQTFENFKINHFSGHTRAFVKIQDGCNFMCSYCSIPMTRGRQRSAPLQLIIQQIKDLVSNNYLEIVLTGVNTAGYNDGQHNFFQLLKAISKLPGNFRVRISSVEPFQITDEIIALLTCRLDRFCNHWHLCLQSGSNHVLSAMNRHYTTEQFTQLVEKIRGASPLVCISTDYIIGFPTESDEDHQLSLAYIRNTKLVFSHLFTYSKRTLTVAAQLKDLHGDIKQQRFQSAEKLNLELTKQYLKQFINQTVEVIFEGYENGVYHGKSSEYCDVLHKNNNPSLLKQLVKLKVIQVVNQHLIAVLDIT